MAMNLSDTGRLRLRAAEWRAHGDDWHEAGHLDDRDACYEHATRLEGCADVLETTTRHLTRHIRRV